MRTIYGTSEIIAGSPEGIERFTFPEFTDLVLKTASYLKSLGIGAGDTVSSLAWNSRRHLQLYFAVPLIGAILNTVNIKYGHKTIRWMINNNNVRALFVEGPSTGMFQDNEVLEVGLDKDFDRKVETMGTNATLMDSPENDPAIICYTSGTTGDPKGVVYTHRSIVLHSMSLLASDVFALSRKDNVLVIVPMYHISGWDVPFACGLTGANIVLPGEHPSPRNLISLIKDAEVNKAIAAPTVWINLLEHSESTGKSLSPLKYAGIGGAEPSDYIIRKLTEQGIETWHLWGMTETESIASISKPGINDLHHQGIPVPGFESMAIGEDDIPVRWDGESKGELIVRGAFTTGGYYRQESASTGMIVKIDGKEWLRTGDIVKIYPNGSFKIVDRDKDLIKSGGEWISSIDLENAIMEHSGVLEAAVIARKDLKWGERPVAVVVPNKKSKEGMKKDSIVDHLYSLERFPKWWIPTDICFVNEIPKTGTGKYDKKALREEYSKLSNTS